MARALLGSRPWKSYPCNSNSGTVKMFLDQRTEVGLMAPLLSDAQSNVDVLYTRQTLALCVSAHVNRDLSLLHLRSRCHIQGNVPRNPGCHCEQTFSRCVILL